eukprot:m51a1_g5810 hypothetical protein (726) ;mRNA; f:143426-145690
MGVSFRAILAVTVCAAVWVPMVVVVVLFNAHSQSLSSKSTEERLPPTATRLGGIVHRTLDSAEKVAKLTANDLSSGSLALNETAQGLRELRVRWHSVLSTYRSTSSVQLLTAQGSGRPGRLVGLAEFASGENLWWWTQDDGSLEQWRINSSTLEPAARVSVEANFGPQYLADVQGWLPSGAGRCWMPIYSWSRSVWSSFAVEARSAGGALWGYAIVDLVVEDLERVLSGVAVANGVAVVVDSATATLMGSTSAAVPAYRTVGDTTVAVRVNETTRGSEDERRVAAVNALVERRYGTWHALSLALDDDYARPTAAVGVDVGGERELVSFTLVRRECLSWVVAVVAPQQRASVDWVPIVVAACTVAVALATLAGLNVLFTRPLRTLSKEMNSAARLSFDNKRKDISVFSEFQRLNDSFIKLSIGIEAMTRYVPMPVVSKIMSAGAPSGSSSSRAGAERDSGGLVSVAMKRVTIMFCDIKGFTTLSEHFRGKVVVQMLSEWLGAYTKVIVKNNGVVDKYVGDCIMALWNAPLDTENPDAKACAAALEFEGALGALNRRFEGDGLPGLRVRVGIHTGELLVGNIGCEDHVNYTVCGTPANTSARIEQLGKVYGLSPLVSGDVARAVGAQYVCVWLDELKLRGHESTVTSVFHLAARTTEAKPSHLIAAETMEAIQELLHSKQKKSTTELVWRLQEALSNPEMVEYYTALQLIQDRITNSTEIDAGQLNH